MTYSGEERRGVVPARAACPPRGGGGGADLGRSRPEQTARAAAGPCRVCACRPGSVGEHVLGCARASVRVPARAASELARV